jgi:hypothetical protein
MPALGKPQASEDCRLQCKEGVGCADQPVGEQQELLFMNATPMTAALNYQGYTGLLKCLTSDYPCSGKCTLGNITSRATARTRFKCQITLLSDS